MATVSLDRRLDAPPDVVRPLIEDVQGFMAAGGFDEVTVEGDRLHLANVLGFARIELTLELIDDPEAILAYEQVDGIFEEMVTRYGLEAANGGSRVTATTEFRLGGIAGSVLEATIVKRQRRREVTGQFDYLAAQVGDP